MGSLLRNVTKMCKAEILGNVSTMKAIVTLGVNRPSVCISHTVRHYQSISSFL